MKVQVSEMLACLFPGFPDEQTNVSECDVGSKRYLNILSQGRALLINEARNLKSLSIRSSNGTFPFCFRTDLGNAVPLTPFSQSLKVLNFGKRPEDYFNVKPEERPEELNVFIHSNSSESSRDTATLQRFRIFYKTTSCS